MTAAACIRAQFAEDCYVMTRCGKWEQAWTYAATLGYTRTALREYARPGAERIHLRDVVV